MLLAYRNVARYNFLGDDHVCSNFQSGALAKGERKFSSIRSWWKLISPASEMMHPLQLIDNLSVLEKVCSPAIETTFKISKSKQSVKINSSPNQTFLTGTCTFEDKCDSHKRVRSESINVYLFGSKVTRKIMCTQWPQRKLKRGDTLWLWRWPMNKSFKQWEFVRWAWQCDCRRFNASWGDYISSALGKGWYRREWELDNLAWISTDIYNENTLRIVSITFDEAGKIRNWAFNFLV